MKNVKIVLIIFIVVFGAIMPLGWSISSSASAEVEQLQPNQIGYYFIVSENSGRYTSYLLLTPRGFERCEGDKNLIHSLEVYREKSLYGKELMPLNKALNIVSDYRY